MRYQQRILWIDLLKIGAIFGIVLLHVLAPLIYQFNKIPMYQWWVANIFDSALRVCVPIFFIISGYFLLGKTERFSFFYLKRIKKVVLPLIIWSVIYTFWRKYFLFDTELSFSTLYKLVILPAYFHLWFIYALIGLYIITPVLNKIIDYKSNRTNYLIILGWFVSVSTIPIFERFNGIINSSDLFAMIGLVGYFIFGGMIRKINISKNALVILSLMLIVSYTVTVLGTYVLSVKRGYIDDYLYGYLSPNIIILSISFFILFKYLAKNINVKGNIGLGFVNILSSTSMGVFLLHPIILFYNNRGDLGITVSAQATYPILFMFISAVMIYLISVVVVYLLQKLPVIKKVVPE